MFMRNWCFGSAGVCFVFALLLKSEALVTTGTVWICTAFILDGIRRSAQEVTAMSETYEKLKSMCMEKWPHIQFGDKDWNKRDDYFSYLAIIGTKEGIRVDVVLTECEEGKGVVRYELSQGDDLDEVLQRAIINLRDGKKMKKSWS